MYIYLFIFILSLFLALSLPHSLPLSLSLTWTSLPPIAGPNPVQPVCWPDSPSIPLSRRARNLLYIASLSRLSQEGEGVGKALMARQYVLSFWGLGCRMVARYSTLNPQPQTLTKAARTPIRSLPPFFLSRPSEPCRYGSATTSGG
jgi:hypothetical protein